MNTEPCKKCQQEIAVTALLCPACNHITELGNLYKNNDDKSETAKKILGAAGVAFLGVLQPAVVGLISAISFDFNRLTKKSCKAI